MKWPLAVILVIRSFSIILFSSSLVSAALKIIPITTGNWIERASMGSAALYARLFVFFLLPQIIMMAISAFLFFYAKSIVSRFSRANAANADIENIKAIDNSLISVLGIYFITDGIAELSAWLFGIVFNTLSHGNVAHFPSSMGPLGNTIVKWMFGIWFVFRNEGVSALIRSLQDKVQKLRTWTH